MKYLRLLIPMLLAAALVACRSGGAPAPRTASLGQEFELAPKQQVVFDRDRLAVEFLRVVEDSRCPTDVTCVWAGEVKVQLSTRIEAAEPVLLEITAGQDAAAGEFRVFVIKVEPERISTREISPQEYRVTLRVERPSR